MIEMYKGAINSPETKLVESINAGVTTIKVVDASVLPSAPNLAVIGIDGSAETIRYAGINENMLVGCERGFQGVARSWEKDIPISRNFTEHDLQALQENIKELEEKKLSTDVGIEFTPAEQIENIGNNENLSVLFGKIAKYFNDLNNVAFTGESKDLTTDDTHLLVTKTEKETWNNKVTQAEIDTAIDKLIGGSGEALDTLYELAQALGHDKDFATTVLNKIGEKLGNKEFEEFKLTLNKMLEEKVSKDGNKVLSTNDYTTVEKNKLAGIQAGAQVNAVTSVNGQTGAVITPNTTYDVATTTTDGLMSSNDKYKLNGVEVGAQKNIMSSADKSKLDKLNYTRAMTQSQYDELSELEKFRPDVWYGIYKE